jgi:glycogen(starch) synthase
MTILQVSTLYPPSRGGMETVTYLLAREFERLGHRSVVLTRTLGSPAESPAPRIVRNPSPLGVFREWLEADVIILHGIPARLAWPLLFLKKPALSIRHMLEGKTDPPFHRRLRSRCQTYCVSRFLHDYYPEAMGVVPNPYDEQVFTRVDCDRDRDLIFVGRLMVEKGAIETLHIIADLHRRRQVPVTATIIGEGPALDQSLALARTLNIEPYVRFLGALTPHEIHREFIRHKLMVFPALWDEPFGITALEAAASGVPVVAYESGGLRQAVGPGGIIVPRGARQAFVQKVCELLEDDESRKALLEGARSHLDQHRSSEVAQRYLEALTHA